MEKNLKEKIQKWAAIQKGDLLMDLINLVNIPSVSDTDCKEVSFGRECQRALKWMLDRGTEFGFMGTDYDGYAGSLSLNGEEKTNPEEVTGIWCHLDVVPAGEGWSSDPFDAVYQDGLVTGRGAQDNKASAVMGLYLLKGLKELGITLKHPAALYFGLNEEVAMKDLDYFMGHFTPPGLSLIADCGFPACYGEKGSMTVVFSTKKITELQVKELQAGVADNIIPADAAVKVVYDNKEYKLKAEGQAGHSAFPEGAKNAIPLLLQQVMKLPGLSGEALSSLKPLYKLAASVNGTPAGINVQDSEFGNLTCCAVFLKWEDGEWKLTFNLRYPHSISYETIITKLEKYGLDNGLSLQVSHHLPSFGFSSENPVILKLTEVYNREAHADSKPYAMAGGTYAAKLPNAMPFGISFPDKSAIYEKFPKGHGDYHQPDESVEVDKIIQALAIYLVALVEIDETR